MRERRKPAGVSTVTPGRPGQMEKDGYLQMSARLQSLARAAPGSSSVVLSAWPGGRELCKVREIKIPPPEEGPGGGTCAKSENGDFFLAMPVRDRF